MLKKLSSEDQVYEPGLHFLTPSLYAVADYVKTADKAKAIAQAHHDSGGSA